MAAELVGAPLGGALFSVARWFPFALDRSRSWPPQSVRR